MPYYWQFIEEEWKHVPLYGDAQTFLDHWKTLSEPKQHLIAACWCHSEITNGGVDQLFDNPTGILVPEGILAFRVLGLDLWAEILSDAIARYGGEYPRDRDDRIRAMIEIAGGDMYTKCFSDLDDRLDLGECVDFEVAADAYARRTLAG